MNEDKEKTFKPPKLLEAPEVLSEPNKISTSVMRGGFIQIKIRDEGVFNYRLSEIMELRQTDPKKTTYIVHSGRKGTIRFDDPRGVIYDALKAALFRNSQDCSEDCNDFRSGGK